MLKVIVAGTRGFDNYGWLVDRLDFLLQDQTGVEIVSGGARGADSLGERYAQERGLVCTRFVAEWDRYGKRAGILRNEQMGQYADALVAFWDGRSVGTKHMIQWAQGRGLKVRVIRF